MRLAAFSSELPDGLLATLTRAQLNPKPHQGVPSKNPALHSALDERNSTAAIGLRASLVLNGIRQSERARYYGSVLGRWTSPDRINLTSARLLNPTNTLNKYIYGGNNPLKYVDPDGQDITIYYRPPNGNLMDFGHVFLGALNQDTGAVKFLDFYPKNGTDSFGAGPGAFNMGNFQDRAGQQFSSLTIQTTPEEAQKVIDFINKLESGNAPGYSAFSNNCTTVCQDALHDLGIDLGDIQPATFWADIFQKYSATALARKQNGIAGMVQNFFQPIRPEAQPGVEYGNPRNFGPGNFDLFNLYLNQLQNPQPKACVSTYDSASGSYSQTCQ